MTKKTDDTTEPLTPETATAGLIACYMRSRGCAQDVAEHTVRLAVRGSGACDAVQFLAAIRLVQNPAVGFHGADVIDWFALTAKVTTTAGGRAVLREAGRMMTLVDAPTGPAH